MYLLVKTTVT